MHLGGTTIPDTYRGRYIYDKEVLRYNGDGEAVVAGYATITWTFPSLTMAEYTWIRDTLLGGNPSVKFTSASLKDDRGTDTTFTNAVAYRPTYEYASNGYVESVIWDIKRIR